MEKYSFIKEVKLKKGYVYVFYELNDISDWKRISMRANRKLLESFIEKIKEEIGFYEDLKKRIEEGQYDVEEETTLVFSN